MNQRKTNFRIKLNTKLDRAVVFILFIGLMGYIVIRLFTVFYVHDELVSIWAYMIDWSPFPYQGYFDANNQFLNSLLGGLFIRLFQSDAIWITRLPNVLSFPLYFFSVVAFHRFFKQKMAFYFFLISLTCTPFILDFFSLARGYGLAWAFFLWALFHSTDFLESRKTNSLILFLVASFFTLYSNLSLLPIVLIVYCFLLSYLFTLKVSLKKKIKQLLCLGLALLFIIPTINYAFNLQSAGKLYLGASTNFFSTSIESLINFMWDFEGNSAFLIVSILFTGILATIVVLQSRQLNFFSIDTYFPVLLVFALIVIFAQNRLLGVNFPENRSAAYLIFLFFGSIAFSLNQLKWQGISTFSLVLILFMFCMKANFTYAMVYKSEHYDSALISKIPKRVKGIPPSTAGVYYNQDNAISRMYKLPILAMQKIEKQPTVIQDYLIEFVSKESEFAENYHIIHVDPISKLALYERNHFLKRTLLFEQTTNIDGANEFIDLIAKRPSQSGFVRCKGTLKNMTLQNQAVILFAQENTSTGEKLAYGGIAPVTSAPIDANGSIDFDFTYTMGAFKSADQMAIYIYNQQKLPLKGEISISFYELDLNSTGDY